MAALCLELTGDGGDRRAGRALESYLALFTEHYLRAKNQQPVQADSDARRGLQDAISSVLSACLLKTIAEDAGVHWDWWRFVPNC